ncbi:MAG: Ig-like domain-containing protein [Gemmatimonadota bacterium]
MRRPRIVSLSTAASAAVALLSAPLLSCGDASSTGSVAVSRVQASPATLAMVTDETRAVTARALDAGGNELSRPVYWSSSDPVIATVSQGGLVTALTTGAAQVAASSGGKSVMVAVSVIERAVALVRLAPATSTIRVGEVAPLLAEPLDATGAPLRGRTVTWAAVSASVATVSVDGVVTGIAAGSATITATSGGVSGTALVTVEPVPAASVVIAPATVALVAGASRALAASVLDSAGHTLAGRAVTWTTSAPTIANVSSTGVVLAIAPGVATITARSEGKSSTSRITVSAVAVASVAVSPATLTLAVAQTAPLVARVADASGAVLNGRSVSWTTSRATVATVDASTGIVTAVATGSASITATSEGKKGSSVITVATVPVATIQVTPANAAMLEGEAQLLKAKLLDAQGNVLTGRPVSWIGGAPAVATVDSTGRVIAVARGSAVIVASSEGARASVAITVSPVTVATVSVTPASRTLESGKALQLTAKVMDSKGRVIAGKVVTWTTSIPSRASVSATGRVVGIATGLVTISATSDGIVGATAVTVTPVKVARITLLPANAPLYTGRTLTLRLQLADAAGRPLTETGRTIGWASSAPTVATVSATGVVTGTGAGTAAITATTDGVTGSATFTVTDVPVNSVSVSPAVVTLTAGSTLQLTATAFDLSGGVIPGLQVSSWRSDAPAIAAIDATGRVSALALGTARLTATIDGFEGSASVTVSAIPISSIVIAPAAPSLKVGAKLALVATLYGPTPNVTLSPAGRTITWSTLNAGVASISATGVLTGASPGMTTVTVRALSPGQLTAASTTISVTVVP